MTSLAEALIAGQEGLRLIAYKDSQGLWTIGYGHLLTQDRDWTDYEIGQMQADAYLESDMELATTLASRFAHFEALDAVRQAVLISMTFQMGAKPLGWPNFTEAVRERDWERAAEAGLDTLWRRQTPKRCELEMEMLRTGDWKT